MNEEYIDLDKLAWERIKEAASKSPWIPPQYFQNDWVSDVVNFLSQPRKEHNEPPQS